MSEIKLCNNSLKVSFVALCLNCTVSSLLACWSRATWISPTTSVWELELTSALVPGLCSYDSCQSWLRVLHYTWFGEAGAGCENMEVPRALAAGESYMTVKTKQTYLVPKNSFIFSKICKEWLIFSVSHHENNFLSMSYLHFRRWKKSYPGFWGETTAEWCPRIQRPPGNYRLGTIHCKYRTDLK